MQGGFSMQSVRDAEQLYAGARSFWKGLQHVSEGGEEGLGQADENIAEKNQGENIERTVIMYSGCRDDQTSADANIAGAATGVSPFFPSIGNFPSLDRLLTFDCARL
jgi:hypothetical protein